LAEPALKLIERSIVGDQVGERVEIRVKVCGWLVLLFDIDPVAPSLPVPHLDLVERTEVGDKTAAQLAPPPELVVPVAGGILATCAAETPCEATVMELVGRDNVSSRVGVDDNPSISVPILNDPVVDPSVLAVVRGKATPSPRGDAFGSEKGAVRTAKW
jgi:hypothetical protein